MNSVYIYDYVEGVTSHWHSGGGLVIITTGKPQSVWRRHRESLDESERKDLDEFLPEPTKQYRLATDTSEQLFIFPDAGCC